MTEVMEDFMPHMRHKIGLFKAKPYHLVLTNERLIFAQATKAIRKQAEQALLDDVKGKGFKARLGAVMRQHQFLYELYQALSPEEILAQTPGNFAIPRHNLLKIRQQLGATYDQQGHQNPKKITLHTTQGKYVFLGGHTQDGDRAYHALKRAIKAQK